MKKRATEKKRQGNAQQQLKLVVGMGALSVLSTATLRGEGFRDATTGAFDLGRSGGRIAQVDDATAVQNNPANLVDVTNIVAELDPSIIYINVDYKSPTGTQSASTMHPLKLLPNFFLSAPLFGDKLAFGFGVTVPYGLANQWPTASSAFSRANNGQLAYTANYGKLTTFNFNPSLAYKICDSLQVGAGLDVMYSSLEIFHPVGARSGDPWLRRRRGCRRQSWGDLEHHRSPAAGPDVSFHHDR
jgi:long-chain fatty acid transport protein